MSKVQNLKIEAGKPVIRISLKIKNLEELAKLARFDFPIDALSKRKTGVSRTPVIDPTINVSVKEVFLDLKKAAYKPGFFQIFYFSDSDGFYIVNVDFFFGKARRIHPKFQKIKDKLLALVKEMVADNICKVQASSEDTVEAKVLILNLSNWAPLVINSKTRLICRGDMSLARKPDYALVFGPDLMPELKNV